MAVLSLPESDAKWTTHSSGTGGEIVVLPGISFHNGTIEMEVVVRPHAGCLQMLLVHAVAFRVSTDASIYEASTFVHKRPR